MTASSTHKEARQVRRQEEIRARSIALIAVVGAVWSENGVLLFSDETFDEFRSRLHRSKFDSYVKVRQLCQLRRQVGLPGPTRGGVGMGIDHGHQAWVPRSG